MRIVRDREFIQTEDKGASVAIGNFDGQDALTEMDALIAYLQRLGTDIKVKDSQAAMTTK